MDDRSLYKSPTIDLAQSIDQGLRSYMIRVYNYMGAGLGITGLVAFLVSLSPELMHTIFLTPLKWVVIFAPLVLVFFISFKLETLKFSTAQILFWTYAALVGVSIASIFWVFKGPSIARVFFITAGTFAATSLYGYTTKKDLTGFGSFLMMGVIGIVIASVVNLFLKSTAMQFIISIISVLVFTGLTAYDTQTIKSIYMESDDAETAGKKALFGALQLYIDFLNIFMSLLYLFGDRRD
jgi:hypothetical protein